MKRRGTWLAATLVAATAAALALVPAPAARASQRIPLAAAPKAPRTAPPNPAFVLWQATSGYEPVRLAASPHGLGMVPAPVTGYAATSSAVTAATSTAVTYPSSYDLRTLGKLTPVRDQGSLGTCWSFAAMGSLESSSLPGESLDLSEDNLALTSGFDVGGATTAAQKYAAGGNADMAAAYLVRWGGPVFETDDAYGDGATPARLTARRHVQDVDIYAGRASESDNDRIKGAVMAHGGVDVSMLWSDAAYNATTKSYCYTGTGDPNHDVVVVGWDDDYPASAFSPAAGGNGAFIVRNSWGAGWGAGGYFYVSYYDTRFARQYKSGGSTVPNDAYTFEAAQPATDYGTVYQYDPLGPVGAMGFGAGVAAWEANVFTASATSSLAAAGFWANAPGTAYEVWEGPSLGSLTKLTTGTLATMGYHTVAVPSGTTLTDGATFVVAVRLTTPGYGWPISYEYPIAGYTSAASAAPGQSYFSSDGTDWTDLTTRTANANVCLKAYASSPSAGPASSSAYAFAADATSGWKTSAQTVTVTATAGSGTGMAIHTSQDGGATWSTTAGSSATISVAGQGSHQIRYYATDSLATEPVHTAGYVNVDTVAPVTGDDHLAASLTAPATVTLTPVDATSGMSGGPARTEYKVGGAAAYTTGTSVVLAAPGTYTVSYRSTDEAGNVEAPDKTFTVTVVGSAAPSSACDYAFAADARSGWRNTAQQFTITAAGGGAGRAIHYSLDGGATWSTTAAAQVDVPVTDGAHHVLFYADDPLADEAVHDAGWVNVDTGRPATRTARASVRKGRRVALKYRVADAAPGCGKAVLKLQVRKRTRVVATVTLGVKPTNAALSYRYRAKLRRGTYTWRVLATDIAGNRAVSVRSARLVIR